MGPAVGVAILIVTSTGLGTSASDVSGCFVVP